MNAAKSYIEDFLDYLEIEKNRSLNTRNTYRHHLEDFLKTENIATPKDINSERVRAYRLKLNRRGLAKNTQAHYIIALRSFLKYLTVRGVESLAPEKIELPKVERPAVETIGYADLERILNAPQGNDLRKLRDKAILETLFSTGLRVSELCALNRDVNLDRAEVTVKGKGGKWRVVFLSPSAKQALKNYLAKRDDLEEALFVSLDKKQRVLGRIIPRTIQRIVDKYARQAGIPQKIHPHLFRHSFATDLLINGADLRAVQELLGHANVATTQIYTHLTNKQLKEIHQAFHARRRRED